MHHLENLLGLLFIFWGSLNIKQIQVLANAFLNMKKARDPAGILYISLRHVPGIECPADLRYQSHALLVICSDLKPSNFRASYSYRVNSGPFFPWSYKTSMLGFLQHTAMGFPADRRDHRGHSLSWVTESFFEFCHHESRSFSEGLFILLSVPSIYSNLGKIPIAKYLGSVINPCSQGFMYPWCSSHIVGRGWIRSGPRHDEVARLTHIFNFVNCWGSLGFNNIYIHK